MKEVQLQLKGVPLDWRIIRSKFSMPCRFMMIMMMMMMMMMISSVLIELSRWFFSFWNQSGSLFLIDYIRVHMKPNLCETKYGPYLTSKVPHESKFTCSTNHIASFWQWNGDKTQLVEQLSISTLNTGSLPSEIWLYTNLFKLYIGTSLYILQITNKQYHILIREKVQFSVGSILKEGDLLIMATIMLFHVRHTLFLECKVRVFRPNCL